jgi:GNAT superfamily N-acetyltransferase
MSVEELNPLLPPQLVLPSGETIGLRFVGGEDAEILQTYFRSLSRTSRYNRFMGDVGELTPAALARWTEGSTKDFTMIAEMRSAPQRTIVGELRCVLDEWQQYGEFGLSIEDRWQNVGVGTALLAALECCVFAMGVRRLFGEALQSNDKMKLLAKKAGFTLSRPAGDWTVVRFDKALNPYGLALSA